MGRERVKDQTAALAREMSDEKRLVMCQLPTLGDRIDTVADLQWLPDSWKASHPCSTTRGFASCWLLRGASASWRASHKSMPLNGLCQLLTVTDGHGIVVTWPAATVLGMGSSLLNQYKWLFGDLQGAPFERGRRAM